jgi:DNA-binding Lrp family transcriptional regulator
VVEPGGTEADGGADGAGIPGRAGAAAPREAGAASAESRVGPVTAGFLRRAADAVRPGVRILEPIDDGPRRDSPASTIRLSELNEKDRAVLTGLVVALKTQGYGYRDIQRMTKLGADTVMRILREARERDQLRDVMADLDMEAVPKAVDNVRRYLARPWHEFGKEATFKVLEGRGALVKHEKSTGTVAASMVFEVKYTNAPAIPPPATGQIAGCARSDD